MCFFASYVINPYYDQGIVWGSSINDARKKKKNTKGIQIPTLILIYKSITLNIY